MENQMQYNFDQEFLQKVNKVKRNVIISNIITWTVISAVLFVLLGLILLMAYSKFLMYQINKIELVDAKIIDKSMRKGSKGAKFYYLVYEYTYNQEKYSSKGGTNWKAYNNLNKGDTIKIEVICSRPDISRPIKEYRRNVSGALIFLVLLFFLAVYGIFFKDKKLPRLKRLIIKTLAAHNGNIPLRIVLDTLVKNKRNLKIFPQLPLADMLFVSVDIEAFSPYALQLKSIAPDPEKHEKFSFSEMIMRADYFLNETDSAYRKIQPLEVDPFFKDYEREEKILGGDEIISLFFVTAELIALKDRESSSASPAEDDKKPFFTVLQRLCRETNDSHEYIEKIHIDLRGISIEKVIADFEAREKIEAKVRTRMHLTRKTEDQAIKQALEEKGFYGDSPEIKYTIFHYDKPEISFTIPTELTIFTINYLNYWAYGKANDWSPQNRKIRMKKKDGSYITLQLILKPGQEFILQRIGEE